MKTAEDYKIGNGIQFEEFACIGGSESMVVSPQLAGEPWDDLALGLLHALEPNSIRISYGEIKCDARHKRITVFLNKDDTIRLIYMEVHVGIPGKNDAQDVNHDKLNDLMLKGNHMIEQLIGIDEEDE